MKRKIVITCDYGEIERIIKDNYGHYYEIPSEEEKDNDSCMEFTCEKRELDEDEKDDLRKFISLGRGMWILQTLVTDLCNKGKLEEGDYVMSISW